MLGVMAFRGDDGGVEVETTLHFGLGRKAINGFAI